MAIKKVKDEDLNFADEINIFHVVPDDCPDKHEASINCWCEPVLKYKNPETGNEVWDHRYTH